MALAAMYVSGICTVMLFSSRDLFSVHVYLQINLRLILVSGKTKEFLFSPNDSASDIAKHVYDNWPMGECRLLDSVPDLFHTFWESTQGMRLMCLMGVVCVWGGWDSGLLCHCPRFCLFTTKHQRSRGSRGHVCLSAGRVYSVHIHSHVNEPFVSKPRRKEPVFTEATGLVGFSVHSQLEMKFETDLIYG